MAKNIQFIHSGQSIGKKKRQLRIYSVKPVSLKEYIKVTLTYLDNFESKKAITNIHYIRLLQTFAPPPLTLHQVRANHIRI